MDTHKKNVRKTEELFGNIIRNVSMLQDQRVDEQMQPSSIDLGKDEKEAWIKRIADQYMRKEAIENPPPELEIAKKDILNELARRMITNQLKKGLT
jgi:hypothetical protein